MAIYLIVLMCLLSHCGFGGSRVVITLYALQLGANQFTVGLLMALYALVPMVFAVAIGRLADRVGARLPMLQALKEVFFGGDKRRPAYDSRRRQPADEEDALFIG